MFSPLLVGKEMRRKEEQPVRVSASKAEASWSNIHICQIVDGQIFIGKRVSASKAEASL